jgi:streptogramin lyase
VIGYNLSMGRGNRVGGISRAMGVAITLVCILLGCSVANDASAAAAVFPARATVSEYTLAPGDFSANGIVEGADGNMWSVVNRGQPGVASDEQKPEIVLTRISPSGDLADFPVAGVDYQVGNPVLGPDGDIWFNTNHGLVSIASNGVITKHWSETEAPSSVGVSSSLTNMALGAEGNLWGFGSSELQGERVLSVTPGVQVKSFPLPHKESGPDSIALGPDGNLWFTEYFGNRIGRITPAGVITEFDLPIETGKPKGIAAGPDGNLWFTEASGVASITPNGVIAAYPVVAPRTGDRPWLITGGPDGRVWFTLGRGTLGRITPDGRLSRVALPHPDTYVTGLAPGADDTVWYTTWGDGPCEGGGGSCMIRVPIKSGAVGRIAPGALVAEVGHSAVAGHRRITLPIACSGGDASDLCEGKLRLHRGNITLGLRRVRLSTDTWENSRIRLSRRGVSLLHGRRRLKILATITEGGTSKTAVVYVRHASK